MLLNDQRNKYTHENELVELRESQRMRIKKDLGLNFISSYAITFLINGTKDFLINKIPIMLTMKNYPQMYKEAITSRDFAFWKEVMNDEIDSILSNYIWILVDLFNIIQLYLGLG